VLAGAWIGFAPGNVDCTCRNDRSGASPTLSRDAHHDGEIHGLPDPFWHGSVILSPRGKGTRHAIPAIFVGVLAIEAVAIGASLPAMLP
jgi:hypothetical protein